mmetsp:Transcript_26777/g.56538  ORF Transcript_26777/g.56538 Transcript_26777/m.56538 type:complete len:226 (+) Transcript_26777:3493-4170(+)
MFPQILSPAQNATETITMLAEINTRVRLCCHHDGAGLAKKIVCSSSKLSSLSSSPSSPSSTRHATTGSERSKSRFVADPDLLSREPSAAELISSDLRVVTISMSTPSSPSFSPPFVGSDWTSSSTSIPSSVGMTKGSPWSCSEVDRLSVLVLPLSSTTSIIRKGAGGESSLINCIFSVRSNCSSMNEGGTGAASSTPVGRSGRLLGSFGFSTTPLSKSPGGPDVS